MECLPASTILPNVFLVVWLHPIMLSQKSFSGGSHILHIHDETLAISESRTTITHNTNLRTLVISKNIVATMMKNDDESLILAQNIRTNARTAHVQNVDYT